MTYIKNLEIAVIGDENLITGMKLGGVGRYYQVEGEHIDQQEIRKALSGLVEDPEIGIVILQEDYVDYVVDIVDRVRESKKATPVIVEVPAKQGTKYPDVRSYYKAFIKKFIGFDAEI